MRGNCDRAVRPCKWIQGLSEGDARRRVEAERADQWDRCFAGAEQFLKEERGEERMRVRGDEGSGHRCDEEERDDCEEGDSDEGDEQAEAGKRRVKRMHDPKLPSQDEVKEHYESGHMPYRSWCHHCVRGRGRERDHQRKGKQELQGVPEYHLDYCFPGDEFDHRLTVLVAVERYTKMKKAVVVPCKGSTGSYAAKMVISLTSAEIRTRTS